MMKQLNFLDAIICGYFSRFNFQRKFNKQFGFGFGLVKNKPEQKNDSIDFMR